MARNEMMRGLGRRSFINILASVTATCVIDPEKLLWRAGEKKIFIPPIIPRISAGGTNEIFVVTAKCDGYLTIHGVNGKSYRIPYYSHPTEAGLYISDLPSPVLSYPEYNLTS